MAEEPPHTLIHNMGSTNLEDVLIKLCKLQSQNLKRSDHETQEDTQMMSSSVRQFKKSKL